MTLRTQVLLLQCIIMLIVIVGTGVTVAFLQEHSLREAYKDRMIAVAQSVASLPVVLDAFDDANPSAVIQPVAEIVRKASDLDYVVVSDANGIRFSHPDPTKIGQKVSTPPDALEGSVWTGKQTGTLGESWRAKVPVFAPDGEIIGQVSVGILESEVRSAYASGIGVLGIWLGGAVVVGLALASGAAYLMRNRIYQLDSDEISGLLDIRDATLHGIGDGIVVLGEDRRIQVCNDAALRLLGHAEGESLVGTEISDVLVVDLGDDDTSPQLALAGERVLLARVDPVVVKGRSVGKVLILMDRTEIDHALRELAGAQSVAEALRAQQHEFANTLHTLGGLLELGEHDAARRVVERAGNETTAAAPSDIADIELAALLIAKGAWAREHGVTLDVDPATAVRSPAADDDDALARTTVLGNLIDNAIEAAGVTGRIVVLIRDDDEALEIRVDDDGPGVPPERRDSVFRLKESTKQDGAETQRGYGLTLVRRVARRRGGDVIVDDSPLGGARFTARLPRAVAAVSS